LIGRVSTTPLGRRADDLKFAGIEVPGECRRIAIAQSQVEIDCGLLSGKQQPLRKIDLENIPRTNVLDGPGHHLAIAVGGEIAPQSGELGQRKSSGWIDRHDRRSTPRDGVRAGLAEPIAKCAQPCRRPLSSSLGSRFGKTLGDQPAFFLAMVEGRHDVIETDCKVRNLKLVDPRLR
jgi:hypothetical protein